MSVAVVILNWNGRHFLEKFVPLIAERTKLAYNPGAVAGSVHTANPGGQKGNALFIADNGSTDGSVEWMRQACSGYGFYNIFFDKNYGFTGGYDKAFEVLRSEGWKFRYYLLLNSDIEVTYGWLERLEEFMDARPECAVCAPKILSYDRREYFEHAGACGGFVDRFYFPYCRGRVMSSIEKDEGQYDEPCKVFWASGAAFMIRADVWHEAGGLDDTFFAHMEEIDLCWRVQAAGWEIWSAPVSAVYHVGGGTLPNNSPRKLYLNFRNNLLMMHKNLPGNRRKRVIFIRMLADGMIACIYLLTGKLSFFKSVWKAHTDYRKMRKGLVLTAGAESVPRPRKWLVGQVLKSKFSTKFAR